MSSQLPLLSMGRAAAFYALVPERLRTSHQYGRPPHLRNLSPCYQSVNGIPFICFRAQVSSVTLTESALSSPRVAAAPRAAAPSRSTRVRSFFNRPAFHAALLAFGISRCTGSGVKERDPGGAFCRWIPMNRRGVCEQ